MVEAGYELRLCRDTFIHHYGSVSFGENVPYYVQLNKRNHAKFSEKWSFTAEQGLFIDREAITMLESMAGDGTRILHVNAGCGATLTGIRSVWPAAHLAGVEWNSRARDIARALSFPVYNGLTEAEAAGETFDVIVVSGRFGADPGLLSGIHRLLAADGKLIVTLANGLYYKNVGRLLKGARVTEPVDVPDNWLQAIQAEGYSIVKMTGEASVDAEDKELVDRLAQWAGESRGSFLKSPYVTLCAQRNSDIERVDGAIRRAIETADYQGLISILNADVSDRIMKIEIGRASCRERV